MATTGIESRFLLQNYKYDKMTTTAFDPLPNNKMLNWPKLEALADNTINVAEMMISLSDREENIGYYDDECWIL